MEPTPKNVRILAIDPTLRGFGFAVLEGPERLVDWGVAEVWSRSSKEFLSRVESFIDRHHPDIIVLEDLNDTRRGKKARNKTALVGAHAISRRIAVRMVSRKQVRDAFQMYGLTKFQVAQAIAKMFPELTPRLPRHRKPWMSEDERMNIFDAASFGLTALLLNRP